MNLSGEHLSRAFVNRPENGIDHVVVNGLKVPKTTFRVKYPSQPKDAQPKEIETQAKIKNDSGLIDNAHFHSISKCSCGDTISQCRCNSPDKKVVTVNNGCRKCSAIDKPYWERNDLVVNSILPNHLSRVSILPAHLQRSPKLSNRLNGKPVELVEKLSNRLENKFVLPSDGWYHLVAKGEHPHPSGVLQVINDDSVNAMVKNFNEAKKADSDHSLLMDYDHLSQKKDGSTEAAGWVTNLEARENGVWGKVAWSNSGQSAIEGGKYRYVSPVWERNKCKKIDGDPNKLSPTELSEVAATNDPNISMTPLTRIEA